MTICFISILPKNFLSCGSLIFDVRLKFTTEVAEDDTFSIIQNAIVDGKLGELSVNVSLIIGIPPPITTAAATTSTTPKSDGMFQILVCISQIIVLVFPSSCCFKVGSLSLVKRDRTFINGISTCKRFNFTFNCTVKHPTKPKVEYFISVVSLDKKS